MSAAVGIKVVEMAQKYRDNKETRKAVNCVLPYKTNLLLK